jgi:hypothetical protein
MTPHLFPWLLLVGLVIMALMRSLTSGRATRRAVIRRAHTEYPAEADLVLSELDRYSGPEVNRVQMDVLSLSAGSFADLKRWTRMALNDYRDVITAAEYGDGEMGSRILRTFREQRPDNTINLSIEELLREE